MAADVAGDDGAWVTDDGLRDRLQQLRSQLQHDIEEANRGLLEELKRTISADSIINSQQFWKNMTALSDDESASLTVPGQRSCGMNSFTGSEKPSGETKRMSALLSTGQQSQNTRTQRKSLTSSVSTSMSQLKKKAGSGRIMGVLKDDVEKGNTVTEIQVLPSQVPADASPPSSRHGNMGTTNAVVVGFGDEEDILTISARNSADETAPERLATPQLHARDGWGGMDGSQGGRVSTSSAVSKSGRRRPAQVAQVPSKTASFLGRLGAVPADIEAEMESKGTDKEQPPWLIFLQHFVRNTAFDAFFGMLIVLNSITIGCQTDHMAREVTEVVPTPYVVMDKLFCIFFTMELVLRLIAFRTKFFKMSGLMWGIFDIVVIGLQLIEEFILLVASANESDSAGGGTNMSFMRVMRILRLIRVLRIIRIIRFMDELRTLVISIMNSMRSLFWTLALLLLGIYVVGIYFTQLSLELRLQTSEPSDVNTYFNVLSRSMLTLYGAMSGGIDWNDLCTPLVEDISPLQGLVFALYIAFTVLALTNVVTGVFVEGALKSAKQEEERNMYETLQQMFFLADESNEGSLSTEQFKSRLESWEMSRYLSSIDINPSEAHLLFELIDSDGSGHVDYAEFVGGCMRIRGAAKAIDVILLLHEVLALRKTLDSYIEAMDSPVEIPNTGRSHTVSSAFAAAGSRSEIVAASKEGPGER